MNENQVSEGSQCVSVRGVPGGRFGYSAPGIYEAKRRQDGTLTWRLVSEPLGYFWTRHGHQMRRGYRSQEKAWREAEAIAARLGIAATYGIRHGRVA